MEPDEKKLWILDAVKGLGLPTVFLGILLFMIWQAGSWSGAEIVMPLFKKQMAFIDKASDITDNMAKAISKIEQTLEDHSDDNQLVIGEINRSRGDLSKSHDEIEKAIAAQTAVLKKIEENTSKRPGTL